MKTRRTGCGRYRPSRSSASMSFRKRSTPWASMAWRVSPSMPAEPRLRRTCSQAVSSTSRAQTLSKRTPKVRFACALATRYSFR